MKQPLEVLDKRRRWSRAGGLFGWQSSRRGNLAGLTTSNFLEKRQRYLVCQTRSFVEPICGWHATIYPQGKTDSTIQSCLQLFASGLSQTVSITGREWQEILLSCINRPQTASCSPRLIRELQSVSVPIYSFIYLACKWLFNNYLANIGYHVSVSCVLCFVVAEGCESVFL